MRDTLNMHDIIALLFATQPYFVQKIVLSGIAKITYSMFVYPKGFKNL